MAEQLTVHRDEGGRLVGPAVSVGRLLFVPMISRAARRVLRQRYGNWVAVRMFSHGPVPRFHRPDKLPQGFQYEGKGGRTGCGRDLSISDTVLSPHQAVRFAEPCAKCYPPTDG